MRGWKPPIELGSFTVISKVRTCCLVFDETGTTKPTQTEPTIDRAVITDFGLARTVEAEQAADENSTTLRGAVLGTMTHAAPEQLAGGVVTTAADVYALGVVLYEMVTGGALPFADASPAEAVHLRLRGKVPSSAFAGA